MFAALVDNLEFFKPKINLAIMLAPVARVDRMSSTAIHRIKDSKRVLSFVEAQGPELFPNPQV
jgi:hypothetical protein